MGRKSKITLDKHDRADQRRRTEKLIEQTKDVSDLNPEPPTYFSETAGSMWRIVVPVLKKMQTVKETDHAIVEAFCITYEQLITAYKDVQEHGSDQWNAVSNVTARFRTGQHLQMHQFHERFCVLPACLQR